MTSKSVKRATHKHAIDWKGVRERIDQIAAVLDIPEAEVKTAMVRNRGSRPLIRFVTKNRLSFDWVLLGDPQSMIRVLQRARAVKPLKMWTARDLSTAQRGFINRSGGLHLAGRCSPLRTRNTSA